MTLVNSIKNAVMEQSNIKPDKGTLLISEPFFTDPFFKRSVVLLIEHNEEGTLGFILNKPIDINLNEALDGFPDFNAKVFFGGPVRRDNLYYVHTLGDKLPGAFEISPGLYWGGNFEILKDLINTKQVGQQEIRFFVGYSGWEPNQLDGEMSDQSWLVANSKIDYVMAQNTDHLWGEILKDMGKQYAILANFPEDPSLN
jgi:putative transcriptional regulator